jgi:hypothetical protein
MKTVMLTCFITLSAALFPFNNVFAQFVDCSAQGQIPEIECLALNALYNNTNNGDGWTDNSGWSGNLPCSASGVYCSGGFVVNIVLNLNGLSGSLPPQIGNFANLKELKLDDNQLTGAIPAAIGNLTSLEYLWIRRNELSGSIPPEIGNLTALLSLVFHENNLTGAIPSQIGSLVNLQSLYLSYNQLDGPIPTAIGKLASLNYLNLRNNQLSRELPVSLMQLTNLVDGSGIDINTNNLYTCDPDLNAFLVLKGGEWTATQGGTRCPSDFFWPMFLPAIIGNNAQ